MWSLSVSIMSISKFELSAIDWNIALMLSSKLTFEYLSPVFDAEDKMAL